MFRAERSVDVPFMFESNLSLAKIPFIVAAVLAVTDATTPPNEPPPATEQVQRESIAEVLIRFLTQFYPLIQVGAFVTSHHFGAFEET